MKKLKFLFAALALCLGVMNVHAYTTDDLTSAGWTKVTASSITGTGDNYYMLVDAKSSAYVMSCEADHYRPCYKTIANPVVNPSFVWILEGSDNKFAIKNYATGAYFKQASGWNTTVGHGRDKTTVTGEFTLNDGKYDIKCVESNALVGHWNDGTEGVAKDGENIAANKSAANADGFFLYAISKATYDAAVIASRGTDIAGATKAAPVDVTAWIHNADWSGDWGGWECTLTSVGNQQWGNKTLESWNATNVIVKQELHGVPNGMYKATADLISGNDNNKVAYVFGTGDTKVSSDPVSAVASAENYNTMSNEVAGNTLTADNVSVTGNTITIGFDQAAGWIVADNFKLYYYGPNLAASEALPDDGAMTADTWYYFDVPVAGSYSLACTTLSDIVYTTDGSILVEDAGSISATFAASPADLSPGRYYVKSSSAQALAVAAASYSYNVGAATSSISEGAYLQALPTTVTFSFAAAASNDPEATFAILDGSATASLKQGGTEKATGTLSLDGTTLTATFSSVTLDIASTYTIEIPAGVVGYAGKKQNEAISVSFNTPVIADGIYYMYNTDTKNYISRSGKYATQAILDNFGLAFIVKTDNNNNTTLQYFDSHLWLGDDDYCYGDCNESRMRSFNVTKVDGGYKFLNTNNNKYLAVDDNQTVANAAEGGTSNIWSLESTADHVANYTKNADLQAAAAATAAGLSEITTKSALEAELTANYSMKSVTITGAKAEKFQQYAGSSQELSENTYYSETVNNLKPGLYRLRVDAFQRAASNDRVAAADGARSLIYLYAGSTKTQLKSIMDAFATTAYSSDFAYDGKHYPNNESSAYQALANCDYSNDVYVYVSADEGLETGSLEIGIKMPSRLGGNFATWAAYNNWTLTYYSNVVSPEDAEAILARAAGLDGKDMQGSIQEALTTAIANFEADKTNANYNALVVAVDDADTSVEAYATANTYFEEVGAVLENTNVYTEEAYNTYFGTPKAAYEAKTLTTEAANALVYKLNSGWHAANTLDDILLSTWTQGGEQCQDFAKDLYINTWSVEGNTDGSEFFAPFFEYWVGSGSLAANSFTSTVTGLKPNAKYSFTIRARVQGTEEKVDDAIMMQVGDGTPVCISAGAKYLTTNFYIGNFSAVGQTDGEGKLVTTITVAGNSNISWLSFYNCNYTEGEDLSAYIADYEFALEIATNNRDNADYVAVGGKEKADLDDAIATKVDYTDKASLIAATTALNEASNAFVAAAPTYTAFADLNATVAETLHVEMPTIDEFTTAADLKVQVERVIVEEYNKAENNYLTDRTAIINGWQNVPGTRKGESWKDGDDNYLDLNNTDQAMTKTVTLAAGDYVLIAKARASAKGSLTVSVGDETVIFAHKGASGWGIATDGTATFADDANYTKDGNGFGWEYRVLTFTSNGETPTTLTFNWKTANSQWASLDDIELHANLAALDYADLADAYSNVAVHILGFENGDYAPYTNVESIVTLETAKNMLANEDANNQEEIDNLAQAITNITWTANTADMDAIYDGDLANATIQATSENVVLDGWVTKSGNTRHTYKGNGEGGKACLGDDEVGLFVYPGTYNYGETLGYTMPLKANTMYVAEARYCSWEGTSNQNFTLTILKNGETMATKSFGANPSNSNEADALKNVKLYFQADESADYVLSVGVSGNTFMTGFHINKAEAEDIIINETADYTPEEKYANVTFNRTVVEGWNGMVLPLNMTIDEVKATFNATEVKDFTSITYIEGNGVTLNFEDATEVKAGKPFLMKAAAGNSSYTFNGVILPETALQTVERTADPSIKYTMTGSYAAQTDLTDVVFALIQGDKYYYHNTGKSSSAKAFRAWFVNGSSAPESARINFNLGDDVVTGISEVASSDIDSNDTYNLQGQRVINAQKGLFIQNGKKVVRK